MFSTDNSFEISVSISLLMQNLPLLISLTICHDLCDCKYQDYQQIFENGLLLLGVVLNAFCYHLLQGLLGLLLGLEQDSTLTTLQPGGTEHQSFCLGERLVFYMFKLRYSLHNFISITSTVDNCVS